jgi:hypothetical protein
MTLDVQVPFNFTVRVALQHRTVIEFPTLYIGKAVDLTHLRRTVETISSSVSVTRSESQTDINMDIVGEEGHAPAVDDGQVHIHATE